MTLPKQTQTETQTQTPAPQHGGQLHAAADTFGIPLDQWLDLSTGINPFSWQPGDIPLSVWQRLPDSYAALESAATAFYGMPVMAVPGSQWAIQTLPSLWPTHRVWLPFHAYEEHRYWWQQHGHTLIHYQTLADITPAHGDIVVNINPNNPTTHTTAAQDLLALAETLHTHDGWLIVDEAFMDATPEHALAHTGAPLPDNVVVLRSMGKFFGLAGLRLGFVACPSDLKPPLQHRLGPWGINHPAAFIGEQAFQNTSWHQETRQRLTQASAQLHAVIEQHLPNAHHQHGLLFSTVSLPQEHVRSLFQHCAQHGILLRAFEQWGLVRIGLAKRRDLQRLSAALECWKI